jgi:hypothetical protein
VADPQVDLSIHSCSPADVDPSASTFTLMQPFDMLINEHAACAMPAAILLVCHALTWAIAHTMISGLNS